MARSDQGHCRVDVESKGSSADEAMIQTSDLGQWLDETHTNQEELTEWVPVP